MIGGQCLAVAASARSCVSPGRPARHWSPLAVSVALWCAGAVVGVSRPPGGGAHGPAAHVGFSGTGVAAYGDAAAVDNFAGITLAAPAVAMASTPDGNGLLGGGRRRGSVRLR